MAVTHSGTSVEAGVDFPAADDGRATQQISLERLQPIDPRHDQSLYRIRERLDPGRTRGLEQLAQEEGIAARALCQSSDLMRRERRVFAHGRDERCGRFRVEWAQAYGRHRDFFAGDESGVDLATSRAQQPGNLGYARSEVSQKIG